MAIIIPDELNDKKDDDLNKRVETLYQYLPYMKEMIEFWGTNRSKDISNANAKIAANTAGIEENANDIDVLDGRVDDLETLGYVVGESGGWTYRKWLNGDYECWYRSAEIIVDCSTAWGNIYYGSIAAVDFPIEFDETPAVQHTVEAVNGGAWYAPAPSSKTKAGSVYMYRPTSNNSVSCYNNIYAKGKWT